MGDFLKFAGGRVVADEANAPGVEIGRPDVVYRRIWPETGPYSAGDRDAAMVRFPGGYVAEIHSPRPAAQ